MFWLLPSSPSSIRPSAEHSLRPVLPMGAPATAGADGADGADGAGAAAASVVAGAAAVLPIDAAEPGAGALPDPGGGAIQPPTASRPIESDFTRSLVVVFIVVLVRSLEPDDGGDLRRILVRRRLAATARLLVVRELSAHVLAGEVARVLDHDLLVRDERRAEDQARREHREVLGLVVQVRPHAVEAEAGAQPVEAHVRRLDAELQLVLLIERAVGAHRVVVDVDVVVHEERRDDQIRALAPERLRV